jgi:hypothetical protein
MIKSFIPLLEKSILGVAEAIVDEMEKLRKINTGEVGIVATR